MHNRLPFFTVHTIHRALILKSTVTMHVQTRTIHVQTRIHIYYIWSHKYKHTQIYPYVFYKSLCMRIYIQHIYTAYIYTYMLYVDEVRRWTWYSESKTKWIGCRSSWHINQTTEANNNEPETRTDLWRHSLSRRSFQTERQNMCTSYGELFFVCCRIMELVFNEFSRTARSNDFRFLIPDFADSAFNS